MTPYQPLDEETERLLSDAGWDNVDQALNELDDELLSVIQETTVELIARVGKGWP